MSDFEIIVLVFYIINLVLKISENQTKKIIVNCHRS